MRNWQGATKGFVGNVAVDGKLAAERTSGGVPYAGTIFTNDTSLGAWQKIVDQNFGQAAASTGNVSLISELKHDLTDAFAQINSLTVSAGFDNRSTNSLNGLNTKDGIDQTYVINVTSNFSISSKINITGDAGDVYVFRWDTDKNPANGYQGQVKFQSGGAIVPLGDLTAANFIHVAGDINASGGGSNPTPSYPPGPRYDDGAGNLITGGRNFSGGGFFTGYWLTTGAPGTGDTASLSNAIFVGGWYTLSDKFSLTSGTSGVYVCPNPATQPPPPPPNSAPEVHELILTVDSHFNPNNIGQDADVAPGVPAILGDKVVWTYQVKNPGNTDLQIIKLSTTILHQEPPTMTLCLLRSL